MDHAARSLPNPVTSSFSVARFFPPTTTNRQSPPPPFRPAPPPPRGQHSRHRAPWQLPTHGPSQVEPVDPDYRRFRCHVTARSCPIPPTPACSRPFAPIPARSHQFPPVCIDSRPFAPVRAHSRPPVDSPPPRQSPMTPTTATSPPLRAPVDSPPPAQCRQ